tara:strand:+ start:232 stop:390 length:159 start_codon:yes stop_codon:yes gene_type:complete
MSETTYMSPEQADNANWAVFIDNYPLPEPTAWERFLDRFLEPIAVAILGEPS